IDTGLRLSRRVNVIKCEELNRAPQSAQIAARHELWAVGRVNPCSESRAGGLLNDGRPHNLAACRSANPVVAGRMKQSLNSHGVAALGRRRVRHIDTLAHNLAGLSTVSEKGEKETKLPTSNLEASRLPVSNLLMSSIGACRLPMSRLLASNIGSNKLLVSNLPASNLPVSNLG